MHKDHDTHLSHPPRVLAAVPLAFTLPLCALVNEGQAGVDAAAALGPTPSSLSSGGAAAAAAVTALHAPIPGRQLLWQEEFEQSLGSGPRPTRWNYDLGDSGWGNAELQRYTDSRKNSVVVADPEASGGRALVIRALRSKSGVVTSARVTTRGKFTVKFGRIEARLKLPHGQGIWPAFWMLGQSEAKLGWPHCGEIDVMEQLGHEPGKIYGGLHGPGYSGPDSRTGFVTLSQVSAAAAGGESTGGAASIAALPVGLPADADFSRRYHVFAVEWQPGRIDWFCDGVRYHSVSADELPEGAQWVFDDSPQFLLLNLAVGGNWPGAPDATTQFPQEYRIDYIRVYAPQVTTPASE